VSDGRARGEHPKEDGIRAAGTQTEGRTRGVSAAAPDAAEATRELFERHSDRIFRFCRRELGSREEAEDAVQATFLNAFRALRRGVVPESEAPWLYAIAQNVCLERARARRRRGRIEFGCDAEALHEGVAATPERRGLELLRLRDAIASMPPRQREAIVLREWRGLSYAEIGERLGLSQSAVETLLFRARRALAQGLETPVRGRRRLRSAFDLSWLAGAVKGAFAGGAAVKGAATVALLVAAGGLAAGSLERRGDAPARPLEAPQPSRASQSSSAPSANAAPALRRVAERARRAGRAMPVSATGAPDTAASAPLAAATQITPARDGSAPTAAAEESVPARGDVPHGDALEVPDVAAVVSPPALPGVPVALPEPPPVAVPSVPDVPAVPIPPLDVPPVALPPPPQLLP
jgi:RNA polymerase sigma factor CnrH